MQDQDQDVGTYSIMFVARPVMLIGLEAAIRGLSPREATHVPWPLPARPLDKILRETEQAIGGVKPTAKRASKRTGNDSSTVAGAVPAHPVLALGNGAGARAERQRLGASLVLPEGALPAEVRHRWRLQSVMEAPCIALQLSVAGTSLRREHAFGASAGGDHPLLRRA